MDLSKLEKRKDYTAFDDIDREDALKDLLDDVCRLVYAVYLVGHIAVGVLVDLWRVAGISSRDGSQWMGRGAAGLLVLVLFLAWLSARLVPA